MADQLRLLHVAPMPPPVSGIGVSVQHLLSSAPLKQQHHRVLDSGAGATPSAAGRRKYPSPSRVAHHLRLFGKVVQATRRYQPHVVHLHGSSHDLSFIANRLALSGAGRFGARTVWHLHQDLEVVQFPGTTPLTRGIFRWAMRAPDVLAVLSEKDRRVAASVVRSLRVVVIPPACTPEYVSTPLERRRTPVRVLYLGWLTEKKGIFDLLRAARLVRERIPDIAFDVLGTGRSPGETEAVRAYIARHSLEKQVRLWGVVTGEIKRQRFAEAHILVMPTHQDAFPVAVLEAMSAGLPVIGSRVGGLPWMLEENASGGCLVDVGDVASIAWQLLRLACDPDARLQLGTSNRQRFLQLYHPDRIGQKVLELDRALVGWL